MTIFDSLGLALVDRSERWKHLAVWQVTYVLDRSLG